MEVILREDIDKLGARGEVVKVAAGYARNFLLPKRLAVAATDSDFADDGENEILRSDALRTFAVDRNVERLGARLHETLRREDMFDFAGADAESQRAERAVRGSVAVAAHKGLAGLRDAEFRTDDVHDTLILAVHVEETHAGFAAVFLEGIELELGIVIENGQCAVGGGDGMVHHRESEIGAADFAPFRAEPGKSLG